MDLQSSSFLLTICSSSFSSGSWVSSSLRWPGSDLTRKEHEIQGESANFL
uniref:Uncharacterized protein n=1 Tax=Nelumbo nucifera TaxID=4432 RepID=A0A822XKH7_NELNU|nr:TPA_asm: hypothetical protein HUJ06_022323 [Nelumbo nucifera]